MISINVRRPRKGNFSVLFDEENCLVGSPFAFFIHGHSTNRPAPETKKFASLFKAAGFLRAESLSRPRKGEIPQAAVKNSFT